MSEQPIDGYRDRRQQLLAGVATRLAKVGIAATFELLEPYYNDYGDLPDGVTGLVVRESGAGGTRMQVTVVRVHRLLPPGHDGWSPDGRSWVRDQDIEYDLDGAGVLMFEATRPGKAGQGSRRGSYAAPRLEDDQQAVVDLVRLWHGYRESFRSAPPTPDPGRIRTRLQREITARRAAGADPQVRAAVDPSGVPVDQRPELAEHLERLDHERLCFHFPRNPNGRYAKRVVALARYAATDGKRGPWLVARPDGDTLVIGVEELIGENQDHRWNSLPWLWHADFRDAGTEQRWQLPDAGRARRVVSLLGEHAVADALTLAGVDIDARIGDLLAGYPTDYKYIKHVDAWVAQLYERLPAAAPWRLAAAYRTWQQERQSQRRRITEPVTLFGLGGQNSAIKPKVALDLRAGAPCLVVNWTGSNARLPSALWDRPADLEAALLDPPRG